MKSTPIHGPVTPSVLVAALLGCALLLASIVVAGFDGQRHCRRADGVCSSWSGLAVLSCLVAALGGGCMTRAVLEVGDRAAFAQLEAHFASVERSVLTLGEALHTQGSNQAPVDETAPRAQEQQRQQVELDSQPGPLLVQARQEDDGGTAAPGGPPLLLFHVKADQ